MIIRMVSSMSGGRYDNRMWPAAGIDFEVPDEEGEALVKGYHAVFVRKSSMAPMPPPASEVVISESSETGAGPIRWGAAPTSAPEPTPEPTPEPEPATKTPPAAEVVHEPVPETEMPSQPKPADTKRLWENYAVAQGMDPDDAVDATKAELMSKYGGRL